MAIRQARVYFFTGDEDRDRSLSGEFWNPFVSYADTLMRGQFKQFSGPEVKGCDLVNLMLFEKCYFDKVDAGTPMDHKWVKLLNTIQCSVVFDYGTLIGSWDEKFTVIVNSFVRHSASSDIPQVIKIGRLMRERLAEFGSSDFEKYRGHAQ